MIHSIAMSFGVAKEKTKILRLARSWIPAHSISPASELCKCIQKLRCFLLQRAVSAADVVEFMTMNDHFHGERRLGYSDSGQGACPAPQQVGGIRGGRKIVGGNGLLEIFQQRGARRAVDACEFAEKFFITAQSLQSPRQVPTFRWQIYEPLSSFMKSSL